MNSIAEILKTHLQEDIVLINYIENNGIEYKKYFVKQQDEFFEESTNNFSVVSYFENKPKSLNISQITQFTTGTENEEIKQDFVERAKKVKNNYETFKEYPRTFDDFDDLYFRANYTILHMQLLLVFGKTVCIESLFNALKFEKELNEIELNYCKSVWLNAHEQRRLEIVAIIENEINESSLSKDVDLASELNLIKDEYTNCGAQYAERINSAATLKELVNYWHPLVLPAPEMFRFEFLSVHGF